MVIQKRSSGYVSRIEHDHTTYRLGPYGDRDAAVRAFVAAKLDLGAHGYLVPCKTVRRQFRDPDTAHGGDEHVYAQRRRRPSTPELRMRAEVVLGALDDLCSGDVALRRDAVRWFLGETNSEPGFSFGELCDALDLDADAVRARVVR